MRVSRRQTLALLAALVAPTMAWPQPRGKTYRVGCIPGGPLGPRMHQWDAFRKSLRELGWIEGQNIRLEFRAPAKEGDPYDELAADLVRSKVDALVITGIVAARAVMKLTTSIPTVITATGNPVGDGLIKSLARPGGNITGLSVLAVDLSAKRVELMREIVPGLSRMAVIHARGSEPEVKSLKAAAQSVSIDIADLPQLAKAEDIPGIAGALGRSAVQALYVTNSVTAFGLRQEIAEMANRLRLPAIYGLPSYANSGGLVAYGPSDTENYRRAAVFLDRILRGANPAEMPFEQPMKLELILNRKSAKLVGIALPRAMIVRADQVIE